MLTIDSVFGILKVFNFQSSAEKKSGLFQFIVRLKKVDGAKVLKLNAIAVNIPVDLVFVNPFILKNVVGYHFCVHKVCVNTGLTDLAVNLKKFSKLDVK